MTARIGLIHAVVPAIGAVEAAFRDIWPEAQPSSLYDQSLYLDLAPDRSLTPAVYQRIGALIDHSVRSGADAVLVTGSLFGPAVRQAGARHSIPVLTSFEAMIGEALARGTHFNMLATSTGTTSLLRDELVEAGQAAGKTLNIADTFVPDAMDRVQHGDQAGHDGLVLEASDTLGQCDAILLGQFSMAPVRPHIEERTGYPTLDPAEAAVRKLKSLFAP
jgi:Asp/Glu/hydantoin racemase